MEPADLAGSSDNIRTFSFGDTINIPCRVIRSDITPVYEWNRDGEVVTDPVPGTSELELSQVTQDDRGTYECVVILTVSGVGGQPLRESIGSVTIGVGGEHLYLSLPSPLSNQECAANYWVSLLYLSL